MTNDQKGGIIVVVIVLFFGLVFGYIYLKFIAKPDKFTYIPVTWDYPIDKDGIPSSVMNPRPGMVY